MSACPGLSLLILSGAYTALISWHKGDVGISGRLGVRKGLRTEMVGFNSTEKQQLESSNMSEYERKQSRGSQQCAADDA